jgi:hypothetical protein
MENPDKAPRPEAKLKNLEPEVLEMLWDLRFKDEEGKRLNKKLAVIQTEVALRLGFTVARSTLSLFFVWLKLKREWEQDAAVADQAKEEWLKERPDASPEELLRVGQLRFTAQSIRKNDNEGFVRLLKAITARENAAANKEKAAAAMKSKIELGLDALFTEIQGNPRLEAAFAKFREEVAKA